MASLRLARNFVCGIVAFVVMLSSAAAPTRIDAGLQVLYDFSTTKEGSVRDTSMAGEALNLKVTDPKAVLVTNDGVVVTAKTSIVSSKPAARLSRGIQLSGEMTLEAWLQSAGVDQTGPARVVTPSEETSERNFTLGQDGDRYDVRFRTSQTSVSGTPSLATKPGTVTTNLTHIVYTRARNGRARIYIDGKLNQEQTIAGSTANWSADFHFALANELSNDRPWLGTFYLVAVYNRDLLPHEVAQNFNAGPKAASALQNAENGAQTGNGLFEREIAPLLARRCLECHDSGTKKGKLDLSTKTSAFAGGKNGLAVVAGIRAAVGVDRIRSFMDDRAHRTGARQQRINAG